MMYDVLVGLLLSEAQLFGDCIKISKIIALLW